MATNETELKRLLDIHLTFAGFKRKGNIWFVETSDCLAFLQLRQSTWGGGIYYLDIGLVLKGMYTTPKMTSEHGILAWEVKFLLPSEDMLRRATTLSDDSLTSTEKDAVIVDALRVAIPFIKRISTIEGIRAELTTNKALRHHVTLAGWRFLKMTIDKNPPLEEQAN